MEEDISLILRSPLVLPSFESPVSLLVLPSSKSPVFPRIQPSLPLLPPIPMKAIPFLHLCCFASVPRHILWLHSALIHHGPSSLKLRLSTRTPRLHLQPPGPSGFLVPRASPWSDVTLPTPWPSRAAFQFSKVFFMPFPH